MAINKIKPEKYEQDNLVKPNSKVEVMFTVTTDPFMAPDGTLYKSGEHRVEMTWKNVKELQKHEADDEEKAVFDGLSRSIGKKHAAYRRELEETTSLNKNQIKHKVEAKMLDENPCAMFRAAEGKDPSPIRNLFVVRGPVDEDDINKAEEDKIRKIVENVLLENKVDKKDELFERLLKEVGASLGKQAKA